MIEDFHRKELVRHGANADFGFHQELDLRVVEARGVLGVELALVSAQPLAGYNGSGITFFWERTHHI